MGGEAAFIGSYAELYERQFDILLELQEGGARVHADPDDPRMPAGGEVADTAKGEGEGGEADSRQCALYSDKARLIYFPYEAERQVEFLGADPPRRWKLVGKRCKGRLDLAGKIDRHEESGHVRLRIGKNG